MVELARHKQRQLQSHGTEMTLHVNEEGDSSNNNNDDFLLVLISSTAITKSQIKRQNVAMTILDANGLSPEVLDAADPNNSNVKDELLKLSNRSGQYPQFFVVDRDETVFLGGYDDLFYANEHGKVLEWLSMEEDTTCFTEICRSHAGGGASADPPRDILISTESVACAAQYISRAVADDGDTDDGDEDGSVDSSATSSSILTWNRWTDVDIAAEPSNGVHFQLRPDKPSSCIFKLTNTSTSLQPVTFKVDASTSDNILVSPPVGVLNNSESILVHVTLTEDARDEMLNLFDKLGPAAEFCQNDSVLIKYCGFSKHLLTGCQADDMKTLSSFWDIRESNNESLWNEINLRVRVSEGHHQKQTSNYPCQQQQSHSKACDNNLWLLTKQKPTRESSTKTATGAADAAAAAFEIVRNRTMETVSTSASTLLTSPPSNISLAEF